MARAPAGLACPACGRGYDAGPDEPWRCACGHALDFEAVPTPSGDAPGPSELDRDRGLWAFEGFLPVERRVTLGEGWTPLVDAPAWDATVKLEAVSPTGSFKDRGAATTLSRAVELGVERVVEDSSGNAGAAIATYAARAGLDAEIYVPAEVKPGKLAAIERAGAEVVRVEGGRAAVAEACHERADADDAWYASHAWNPAFYAGTATFAYELCAQRGWRAPDVVVLPLGHGTLFLGAYRGFEALRSAGWIDSRPRLLGAQAAGHAPVADSLHDPTPGENDLADGIQIDAPARPDQLLEALEVTGGDAIAVGEAAVREALDELRAGGFDVEPTSAAAPAALREYRARGVVDPDEDVVVALTGSGLKT
ncbi:MAG: pyridoxal-phosphate dependent enzyme [Halobacteriales archaeon]|nr:pyridoxal-phosphate dependent enzyme [Halobacteriales archaeon]